MKNNSILDSVILGTSAVGSLLVTVRIGVSLSTAITVLIGGLSAVALLGKGRISRSTVPVLAPILLLTACFALHDMNILVNGGERFENITLNFAAASSTLLIPALLHKRAFERNAAGEKALGVATIIYLSASIFIVLFWDEEPAFAIAGIPLFAYHLAKFTTLKKIMSLMVVCILLALSIVLESRIVLISQITIIFFEIFSSPAVSFIKKFIASAIGLGFVAVIADQNLLLAMFSGGDGALKVGEVAINTSGRIHFWQIVYESAWERPLIGSGFSVPEIMFNVPRWAHPHNDYLRLFHKLGFLGVALWFWFFLAASAGLRRVRLALSRAVPPSAGSAILNRTALLSLVGLAVVMLTDNPFAYPYVMIPVAYLVGLALSMDERRAKS